jgi:5-methylcytosine-specific restriction enzyme B
MHWRDVALLGGGSVLTDDAAWTTSNLEVLDGLFTQDPDETDRTFAEKLRDQLATCSGSVKQLAAELMWLLLLCPSNVSAEKKRENIKAIWDWSDQPFPAGSSWLADEVLLGIGSAGPGFSNRRPRELTFCINFLLAFRKLDMNRQASLASQPWEFAEWLQKVPDAQARQFRHMILYLLFPDDFERVFSAGDRKSIAEHFAGLTRSKANKTAAVELDKVLRQTRIELEQKYGTKDLDYYCSPPKELWQRDWAALADSLTADHVRQAVAEIDRDGIPIDARSSAYDLVESGKR